MKKFLFVLMTALFTLVSCDETNTNLYVLPYYAVPTYIIPGTSNNQGQFAIAFGGYTNGQTRAIINSESQTGYDDFTLYSWTKDSVVMDKYHAKWVDNGWTYVGVDGQQLKYFDNFVDEYNFIGVIPQTTASIANGVVTTNAESFAVDNESTTDTPKEFLYAVTTVAKANYGSGVNMNFAHGNAKVYLAFTSDDANTEILDYAPAVDGYTIYEMRYNPSPALGPKLTDVEITDEDIEYINSRYTSSLGWLGYYSNNNKTVLGGDLDNNMAVYLKDKYGESNISKENWVDYINNNNMRLIHIDKSGKNSADGDSYRAWFVNVQNVNKTVIGTSGSEGVPNVLVLPAASVNGDGSDAELAAYPTKANVNISLNGLGWDVTETSNSMTFTKPSVKIASNDIDNPVYSPTTWFTLPCNDENVGYTVKVSYKYKGVNVYDSRVFIPAAECKWDGSKYYLYVIKINGRGNGHSEPNNLEGDDPTIEETTNNEIQLLLVTFSEYGNGGTTVKVIK